MSFRTDGTDIYSEGDDRPFHLSDPPDVVISNVESAEPGKFVPFRSTYTNRTTGERTERTVFLRADKVWAICPSLIDPDDDEDGEPE